MTDNNTAYLMMTVAVHLRIAEEIQDADIVKIFLAKLSEEDRAFAGGYFHAINNGDVEQLDDAQVKIFADRVADPLMYEYVGLPKKEALEMLLAAEIKLRMDKEAPPIEGWKPMSEQYVESLQGRQKKFAFFHMHRVCTGRREPLVSDEAWAKYKSGQFFDELSPLEKCEIANSPEFKKLIRILDSTDEIAKDFFNKRKSKRQRLKDFFFG